MFAPGVDGIIQDYYTTSLDGGENFEGSVEGCSIISLGYGSAKMVNGDSTVNTVFMYSYGAEAQRLSRFKQKLFYTAVEDSVARVISPFLHHNTLQVRLLARGWASRTQPLWRRSTSS